MSCHQCGKKADAYRCEKCRETVGAMCRACHEKASHGEHGATDEEMQQALGIDPNTQRPRRVELHEGGMIADSNKRRPTRSGRGAVVWVATPRKDQQ